MHITTHLDLDVIAVEGPEQVSLLVELTAPTVESAVVREPSTLVVVLDRSGSMAGERLEGAKHALITLLDRLDPTDRFGLVTFDDSVELVVPSGPLTDKAAVRAQIAAIHAGGSTDLSAGYLRGLQEARRTAGPAGATVLLVSDGHANAGVTDPVKMGEVAAKGYAKSITTSTLGFGLGYDESLLGALTHMAALLTDRGVPPSGAVLALSAMGAASLLGRLTTGWLLNRFFAPRVGFCLLSIAALGTYLLAGAHSLMLGIIAAALIGFGMGAEADVTPYTVALSRPAIVCDALWLHMDGVRDCGCDRPNPHGACLRCDRVLHRVPHATRPGHVSDRRTDALDAWLRAGLHAASS